MGCFLACFGISKDQKRESQIKNKVLPGARRQGNQTPRQSSFSPEHDSSSESTNLVSEATILLDFQVDKLEEQLSLSTWKKVTFNTNVKAYEPIAVHESTEFSLESGENITKQKGDSSGISTLSQSLSEDDSFISSFRSYPRNHKYQNCRDNDTEADAYESKGSDLEIEEEVKEDYGNYDEDEENQIFVPTKLVESRTEILSAQAFVDGQEWKKPPYNPSVRDRSAYIHPVFNPVENLTQWKAVKSKVPSSLKPQKENLKLEQEAPCISFSSESICKQTSFSFRSKSDQPKSQNQETAVDASLSNWLVTSETTPTSKNKTIGLETISQEKSISQGSNSVASIEDRPILGALTVEELKQFSASSSPRRSPSPNPDEMAIIGTVGTYWGHTEQGKDSGTVSYYNGIPNTTSKYREDKRVNWHSTPFETRLDRALNRRAAEA